MKQSAAGNVGEGDVPSGGGPALQRARQSGFYWTTVTTTLRFSA